MRAFEASRYYFDQAAEYLKIDPDLREALLTSRREVRVRITIERDNGRIANFVGFRVQHDNYRGPMKGGLRFHHEVNLDETRALARA